MGMYNQTLNCYLFMKLFTYMCSEPSALGLF